MDFTNTQKQKQEEFECNAFAGKFLVPYSQVEATNDLKEIRRFANKLGVSREVYLRRMKDEELISDVKFFTLLDQIKATYKESSGKSSGFVMPEVKSKASRGETFFNMVLDAVNNNQISYTEASDVLDLRVNRLVNEL
jgi:Zn-dependent peptidase ImmA (M78 family)